MGAVIKDVTVTSLKKIDLPQGAVMHALKASEKEFKGFGEAYFSLVGHKEIKGWKKHTRMTLNLIVPLGAIKFVVYDDREDSESKGRFFEITLSTDNYQRLTIGPGLWMAFQGIDAAANMLLNVANIEHDPDEAQRLDNQNTVIPYNWDINE